MNAYLPEYHRLSTRCLSNGSSSNTLSGRNSGSNYHQGHCMANGNKNSNTLASNGLIYDRSYFIPSHNRQLFGAASSRASSSGFAWGIPSTLRSESRSSRTRRSSEVLAMPRPSQNSLKRLSSIWSLAAPSTGPSALTASHYQPSAVFNSGFRCYFPSDQYESLSGHTLKGIEFLDRYGAYVKDRCQVECEYASKLKGLVKKYAPKKKEDEDVENLFSYEIAFNGMLGELNGMANQHEVVAESFKDQVLQEMAKSAKEFRDQRKDCMHKAMQLQQQLQHHMQQLSNASKDYQKAVKEADLAAIKFEKANADLNLSRADLQKANMNQVAKHQQADEAKATYALVLQRANEFQAQYYNEYQPHVFEELRQMDERRILRIRDFILQCVNAEKSVLPIIQKCLDGMEEKANKIDPNRDSDMVVRRYATGYPPPGDNPFVDLQDPERSSLNQEVYASPSQFIHSNGAANGTMKKPQKKWFTSSKPAKEVVESTLKDYSDLPPNKRCQKLNKRIAELEAQFKKLIGAKEGMQKLMKHYEMNPKQGSAADVQKELSINATEIAYVQSELNQYKGFLEEATSQLNTPRGGVAASPQFSIASKSSGNKAPSSSIVGSQLKTPAGRGRSSISDDSLSRSASESSVSQQGLCAADGHSNRPGAHSGSRVSSNGPSSSPANGSHLSNVSADFPNDQAEDAYNDADADNNLPILGTATLLYNYDGGAENTLAVREGEQVYLLDHDSSDGWTHVRRANLEQGFVPTTYLECHYTDG